MLSVNIQTNNCTYTVELYVILFYIFQVSVSVHHHTFII